MEGSFALRGSGQVQRVRGQQDGRDEKRNKTRNKEVFEVRKLVSEWNDTISHHTDKDREKKRPKYL